MPVNMFTGPDTATLSPPNMQTNKEYMQSMQHDTSAHIMHVQPSADASVMEEQGKIKQRGQT